jgi:hypothetical protein
VKFTDQELPEGAGHARINAFVCDIVAVDRFQSGPGELSGKIVVPWHRDHGVSLSRFLLANDCAAVGIGEPGQPADRNGKRPELETYRDGSLVDSQG